MATFNNLRPFLECDFADLPESKLNVWTGDWPEAKSKSLALREEATRGAALPQVFDPMAALTDKSITELVSAMQIEPSASPEKSLSFAELRDA